MLAAETSANQEIRTEVNGFLETGGSEQARGIADTTTCRDDLSSTAVNGIGVQLENAVSKCLPGTENE